MEIFVILSVLIMLLALGALLGFVFRELIKEMIYPLEEKIKELEEKLEKRIEKLEKKALDRRE